MADMNVCVFSGRLGGEPRSKEVDGKIIIQYRIAVNGRKDDAMWITVEQWNPGRLTEFLKKGTQVVVSGRLELRIWEDKEGKPRHDLQLTANSVSLVGSRERPETVVQGSPMKGRPKWEGDDTPF
jgi:single-strand DNA-binding protein